MSIDLSGFEFDWLACDGRNHVAFFSTAGAGFYPVYFSMNLDEYRHAIGNLLKMKETSDVAFFPEIKAGLKNDWRDLAARGLFSYDCDPCGGDYVLVAKPLKPIFISDLPRDLARIVSIERFKSIDFSASNKIKPSDAIDMNIVEGQ